jgi:hypothetical protein
MNVYDVFRCGVYVRQIVAWNIKDAQQWIAAYMPSCTVRFAYTLR